MEELSKAYEPTEVEKRWYPFWTRKGYFHAEATSNKKPYAIVIPPPNVTGSLHMGHALNNTLQDILVRWRRMSGDNVLWMPGTDHAGIATQNVVERQLAAEGKKRDDLGRVAFIERVWKWKEESGGIIINQLKRLGASCDWERERFTMDAGLSRAVREAFVRLYEKDLIYRGDYLINWCPRCHTALSDLEVEHDEQKGFLWHIRYPLVDGSGHLVVATTRPETMLGDTAVAVNPNDGRYSAYIGKKVALPLANREIPVIADEHVDTEFGTGCLKITPAHDPNDFEIGLRHGLPSLKVIDEGAHMNAEAGTYAGMDRYHARRTVVADLEKVGLLEKTVEHMHSVGHCYRCKTVIEPNLSKQWFVRAKPLAQPAMEAVRSGRTRIVPQGWENTYFDWMENIRDWCISRQIWWGHRIPAWHCGDCGKITVAKVDPDKCAHCGSQSIRQETDVLDTWFSSSLWPFSTLGWPDKTPELAKFYPTSTLVTGFDILFFWVARMMMMGIEMMGEVPFRDVYIHALVRDAEGQKMSKSKGNVIDPLIMMEKYGTDAFRFTLAAMAAQGRDVKLAEERIEGYRAFCNKLWNASRFVMMNLEGSEGLGVRSEELSLPDRWIVNRLQETVAEVNAALAAYRFNDAANAVYQFLWSEFCDWYLELIKPIMQGEDEAAKQSTRRTMVTTLETVLRLLHPFMPFITEEIWQKLPHEGESIMTAPFPQAQADRIDAAVEAEMGLVMEVIRGVRNIRGEMNIAPSTGFELRVKAVDEAAAEALKKNLLFIQRLARITQAEIGTAVEKPAQAAIAVLEKAEIYVPMAGLMDVEAETARLDKELKKVREDLEFVEKKLSNPNFSDKAPADIVAKEREKLAQFKEKEAKILEGLQRISAMK